MLTCDSPVVVAGAGPVGMVAAADLVLKGVPVLVLEKLGDLSMESRASTFHPPTLDMLDDLGFAGTLVSQGLKAPTVQYCDSQAGVLGTFDFSGIADLTRHPYRLQAEQFKLTRIILNALRDNPLFRIEFHTEVVGLTQEEGKISLSTIQSGEPRMLTCEWLIGADGANSIVRRGQDIDFEGFTWPERFLVMTTTCDLAALRPGVSSVSYVADPDRWYFMLRIIDAWRVMMPVPADMSDEAVTGADYIEASIRRVIPAPIDPQIQHVTLYRVHQRVAKRFREGRSFLAGDAAHINNPLGGMGMNGGIHDALNLTGKLAQVVQGKAPEALLDDYEAQRRAVTLHAIQTETIRNKRNLEASTPDDRARFREEIAAAAASPEKGRELLYRIAMFGSLERAASITA